MRSLNISFFLLLLFSVSSQAADAIKIISISPTQTEKLKVGSKVKISYQVEYTLESSEMGQITLVVQDASGKSLANEFYIGSKGTHKKMLEAIIIIPETRLINVFTPLSPGSLSSTSTVDMRVYKVVK